ncbi:hypothetical protein B0T18DRAFT_236646 [Schizothecium vesticola]|uniref:Uncharacterized protein n=1 Tax=Schizothecium vesticola TaxID=314040 RepID=A0AA40BP99_9PEZI|nr:hypothetical protein B0T18DRAFT_236646 [Schizothecium vesticola]
MVTCYLTQMAALATPPPKTVSRPSLAAGISDALLFFAIGVHTALTSLSSLAWRLRYHHLAQLVPLDMILLVIIILSLIHFPRHHAHRRTKDQKNSLEVEDQAREDSPANKRRQIPKRRTSQVWHVQY